MADSRISSSVVVTALFLTFLTYGHELESWFNLLGVLVARFVWLGVKIAFSFCILLFVGFLVEDDVRGFVIRMEAKALELLEIAKSNTLSWDQKQTALVAYKSEIKQRNVPEAAVRPTFEALRTFIATPRGLEIGPAFQTLSHLIKRLTYQRQPQWIASYSRVLQPVLLERLGDNRERVRAFAAQAFTELWPAASAEVEYYVLDTAMVGRNPRAKEMALIWLSNMSRQHGLRFRQYVASLVNCLEDADPAVRDAAKSTVVELFGAASGASARAKADLMTQLSVHNVRKSIVNAILTSINLDPSDLAPNRLLSHEDTQRPTSRMEAQPRALSRADGPIRPKSRAETLSQRPHSRADGIINRPTIGAEAPSRPISRADGPMHRPITGAEAPSQRPMSRADGPVKRPISRAESASQHSEVVKSTSDGKGDEPLNVGSSREIEDIVRGMVPHFEGRESEDNWATREENVMLLRRIVRGNASEAYSTTLITSLKSILDGIFKVVNSLRTTMTTNGCLLLQDMAIYCGSKIDSMMEIIMQNLIKLSAGMKKITAQNGKSTVEIVIQHVTFTPRILQHICNASQDKNAQLRLFSADWIKIILEKQANHKSSIEHGGGLDLLEKGIKKGISDPNPAVRQAMRGAFWVFFSMWPAQGNEILSNLDPKSRSQLEKDPGNPNIVAMKSDIASRKSATPSVSSVRSRSALQEAIAAQKKAHLAPKVINQQRPTAAPSLVANIHAQGTMQSSQPDLHLPSTEDVNVAYQKGYLAAKTTQRSDSAQSVFTDTDILEITPSQSAVRSMGNTSSASSLSSAPMRPAGKARRPELSRPGTADSYTVRSNTSDSKSDVHITVPMSTTAKAKAKKLDIAKTRATEPRANGNPQENKGGKTTGLQVSIVPTEHDIPVEAQSESPHVTVVQMLTASEEFKQKDFARAEKSGGYPIGEQKKDQCAEEPIENRPAQHFAEPIADVRLSDPGAGELEDGKIDSQCGNTSEGEQEHSVENEGERQSQHEDETETREPKQTPPLETFVPIHLGAKAIPVQIYEDPIVTPEREEESIHTQQHVSSTREEETIPNHIVTLQHVSNNSALAELSLNEPVHRDSKPAVPASPLYRGRQSIGATSPTGSPEHRRQKNGPTAERKRSISPRSKDPAKAREMLEKGIQKIRSKNMDILGHRKLQGLIEYHDSIFLHEGKYDEMLLVLLEELESPPDEKRQRLGRPLDLKTQVLLTVRFMLAHNKHFVSSYYPRAIAALISARNYYDSSSHIINGLNETAEEILGQCEPESVIDAVTELVSTEDSEKSDRAITMGFSIMTDIFKRMNSSAIRLSESLVEKVGSLAGRNLTARQPDVRRQATQLCVQLHTMADNDDHFWQLIGWPRENSRNLLTYYIARK
ncbi:uncharacterized protein BP01DRAFT_379645 [Aspergillus saccharolyticus JOP 1030-1]|uniref:ARM repeat-containing protein n=1 Tax=Aspergillus saccharolyticus JOP 1030-1 TaxID=1450539 RepID=A0A318ZVR7_9EURO|nr:ARM repeat-containing protein [Aspergillus saccharolyticus JOP 1030-1]PYH48453.1 ARM repeat-containing protein [Aspergillus saccharolyticus JOP 1030-1]